MGSTVKDILGLINPAPLADPEDDNDPDTGAKVVERYEESDESDVADSDFKKRKPVLLDEDDERYEGRKASRKSLGYLPESDEELSDGSKDDVEDEVEDSEYDGEDDDDEEEEEEEDDDDEEEDEGEEEFDGSKLSVEDDTFQHMSKRDVQSEVEKGVAVRNQLNLWDKLLECRIQLQKCVIPANKLPQPEMYEKFISEGGQEYQSSIQHTKKSLVSLLDKLLNLQSDLIKGYSETRNLGSPSSDKRKRNEGESDEEIPSSTEEEEENEDLLNKPKSKDIDKVKSKRRKISDYAAVLEDNYKRYEDYRNATIQKWNDKTRIAVGHLSSKNFSAFEQSTLKQIEQILSNKERLIRRTQLKRSVYDIVGVEKVNTVVKNEERDEEMVESNEKVEDRSKEYDVEIFDDTDFYHQLLRELIERKSSDITDPIQLGKQWVELQKLRSKMKRKVDTKASKGRKIRYVVHPKLVNFMAPIPSFKWTEEAKNELYSSLFGKKSL